MSGMKFNIKYVQREVKKGKEYFYFRKNRCKRIKLRGPIGSEEFWEDYNSANGQIAGCDHKDSMAWLCEQYKASTEFRTKLKSKDSRSRRIGLLDKFCGDYGEKPYAKLETRNLRAIRDKVAGADLETPHAWNNLKKAISAVFEYAIENDLVNHNPVKAVKKLPTNNPDGFHTWTMEEVEQYRRCYPVGTKQRLAMEILLNLGQRRSDVISIGRQHIKNNRVMLRQKKTKTILEIPLTTELQENIPYGGELTLLLTKHGKPYSADGFGNFFRECCDKANLPHCTAHGLRKACATALAEAGATSKEIMAVGGWKSLQDVQIYIAKAEQKHLADSAIRKVEQGQK